MSYPEINLATAISLARSGLYVFPCQGHGVTPKAPCPGILWKSASTRDEETICSWWKRFPGAVPAIDPAKSGHLIVDCDCKNGHDGLAWLTARANGSASSLDGVPAVTTPSGGRHLYFQNTSDPPHGNGRGAIPPDSGVDIRGHGGYVVAPGAVFSDGSGEYTLAQGSPSEAGPVPEWLALLLEPPPREPLPQPPTRELGNGHSPSWGEAALRGECGRVASSREGGRNNALNEASFRIGQLVPHILAHSDATEALEASALAAGLPLKEIRATLRSGLQAGMATPRWPEERRQPGQGNGHGGEWREEAFDPDTGEVLSKLEGYFFEGELSIEPPPALIKGILPKEGIAFVGGQSGAGKSFMGIHLAMCLATGTPFFNHKIKERVGTLILAAEGSGTLPIRIEAAKQHASIEDRLPIVIREFIANLSNDCEVNKLCDELVCLNEEVRERFGCRLGVIEIDTVAASFSLGDGDPNAEAAASIRSMRAIGKSIGALVLPIHHYGKDEKTGLLGASGWRAGADGVLSILADRNQITGDVSNRSIAIAKSRVGAEGSIGPFDLEFVAMGLDEEDEIYGSLCVVPGEGEVMAKVCSKKNKMSRSLQLALSTLKETLDEFGQEQYDMGNIPNGTRVTTIFQWRERSFQRGISMSEEPRARQIAFKRASEELVGLGHATVWGEFVWLTLSALANKRTNTQV